MKKEVFDALSALMKDMGPPELRTKGWVYKDFNARFSEKAWNYLLNLIGEGEYEILISSSGIDDDNEKWIRGQFMISPQGMKNLTDEERQDRIRKEMEFTDEPESQ